MAKAPRTNIASIPSMRLGGRDGRNQTFTAPMLKIGVKSSDTRTWTRFNFLLRQEVTNATSTKTAPTANQPLHSNRMKKSSFMCVLLPSNARDEWCRNKGVRIRTESEFRHPLQRDCWTFSWLINRVIHGVAKRKVMIAAQTATEHNRCKPTQGDDEFLTSECPKQGTRWHKQAR